MTANGVTRPRTGRILGGVCAGLAERYGWPVGRVRLCAVLSCVLPGPQLLLYGLLWVLLPERD